MVSLIDLKEINKNQVAMTGGKGSSLGELSRMGVTVPDGFVVCSSVFEQFLIETNSDINLETLIKSVNPKDMHAIEAMSKKIQRLIQEARIPEEVASQILNSFTILNSNFVAVRSSATAEDSVTAAWAGQLESYLNTTRESLLQNIKKCWASLFTARAIYYRFQKGLTDGKISVAVIVQKMVASEKSGIAFSVHPINKDNNQMIIEAGLGLGEAIVSGQITPDSYIVEKDSRKIIDKNINIQTRLLRSAPNGGNEWIEILKNQGERQTLSDQEILNLTDVVCNIEKNCGFPCDVEWAMDNGKLYILQSRPITTLK